MVKKGDLAKYRRKEELKGKRDMRKMWERKGGRKTEG